jgi:hypothetical protein
MITFPCKIQRGSFGMILLIGATFLGLYAATAGQEYVLSWVGQTSAG